MGNSVKTAKLAAHKNSCTLDDVEIVEKDIHQVLSVDENGEGVEVIETYSMEAFYAYYGCNNCGEVWDITDFGMALAWELVKEHLNA